MQLSRVSLPTTIHFLTYSIPPFNFFDLQLFWTMLFTHIFFLLKDSSFCRIQDTWNLSPTTEDFIKLNTPQYCLTWSKTRNISIRFILLSTVRDFKLPRYFDFRMFTIFKSCNFFVKFSCRDFPFFKAGLPYNFTTKLLPSSTILCEFCKILQNQCVTVSLSRSPFFYLKFSKFLH